MSRLANLFFIGLGLVMAGAGVAFEMGLLAPLSG